MKKFSFSDLRSDLPAGLVVFLIAVPLCLGIALASGAPLYSGLIAGMIGGIVIGLLSNSPLSVSGPAAGLTAVVLVAVTKLGSFETFLLAVVLAGVLQLALGFLKAGSVVHYFPSNVIKGMLTAIGVIIILKQLPHLFGYDKDSEGDLYFLQPDGENTFSALLQPLFHIDLGATIVALTTVLILILWDRPFMKKLAVLPGPLIAVLAAVGINELFIRSGSNWALGKTHLVNLPVPENFAAFKNQFVFPDFSKWANPQVYMVAFTIAVVASIETLLCIEAIDKLDPKKRSTSANRELKAQGIGNLLSGLLGGLPVTSVIVRSSANLNAGAKSKAATIVHGLLILVCVTLIPGLLNKIPLAALAGILLITGFKLAKPSIFHGMFRKGFYQWLPFLITVIAVVFTDLLTGVAVGMAVAAFLILRVNMKSSYFFHREEYADGDQILIRLGKEVTFLNRASIRITLEHLPPGSHVTVDASQTIYVDDDVLELFREFKTETAPLRNIHFSTIDLRERYTAPVRSHVLLRRKVVLRRLMQGKRFVTQQAAQLYHRATNSPLNPLRVLSKEEQELVTPALALQLLKDGNERFVNNLKFHRNLLQQVNETKDGQYPLAVVLSCIDSRTSAELIFDQGLGDIFSVRIAGNVLNDDILGSMEFACKVAGSKVIVVLGHTRCGAVKGACEHVELGHLTGLLGKLKPAMDKTSFLANKFSYDHVDAVATNNVHLVTEEITQRSPILAELLEAGKINIVGAMYDVETGNVEFFEKVDAIRVMAG